MWQPEEDVAVEGTISEAARSPVCRDLPDGILSSWNRCLRNGLDPFGRPEDAVITARQLRDARSAQAELLRIVRPELEMLASQIAGTNHMVAFADETGIILDTIMDTEFEGADCAGSVRAGSVWLERLRGTNALGLALVTGQTSVVTGGEHFFDCHAGVSCVSAPVHGPDGRIVGLLDASSEIAERQAHTRALVDLAALNIGNRLFLQSHREDHVLRFHPRAEYLETQGVGMIAMDGDGRITGANRMAARLLSGLRPDRSAGFVDLFREEFGAVLRRPGGLDVIRLTDRLGACHFARLQVARHHRAALVRLERIAGPMILDDDLVRESLRVACNAVRIGQPVCIRGQSGTGRTGLAEEIHRRVRPDAPLIAVECRRLVTDGSHDAPPVGATLLLEDAGTLGQVAPEALGPVFGRLRRDLQAGRLSLLATDGPAGSGETTLGGLRFLTVDLPPLAERSDFDRLARGILADLSPRHQLSADALHALARIDRPANLHDLRHHLQLLVARSPAGILRGADIARLLPRDGAEETCDSCAGTPIREQRCREIRRMLATCHGNVALAARRLGVSRNTVYAHVRD